MDRIKSWLKLSSTRFIQLFTSFQRFARKALFVIGIVCGVALAAMLFGLAIDSSPASNISVSPDWQHALSDPTYWGIAEKLFACLAIGYMLGMIPGGILALTVATWVSVRRDWMAEVQQAHDFVVDGTFDLVDQDQDGKIQDKDLIDFHQKVYRSVKPLIQYLIRNRARIGTVEVLPDGTATYSITSQALCNFTARERERISWVDWIGAGILLLCGLVAFAFGIWACTGLSIFAEVVTCYVLLKRKVRLQRFIQREFERLDANGDGLVDELEIVQLWPMLAESEQRMLTALHSRIGEYGHDVLRDGLTISGVTRLEVDTCVPTAARLIV